MGVTNFYSFISRMKHINRWGLMRNTNFETLQEHSMETAVIAHALALIDKIRFGNVYVNPEKVAVAALFHDATEIYTGDMPTPIKYANDDIKAAYKAIETEAERKLLSMLPGDLAEEYLPIIQYDESIRPYVKAADKISALIKCIEERNTGNHDFDSAYQSIVDNLSVLDFPPAEVFMDEFLDGYFLTIDEQR